MRWICLVFCLLVACGNPPPGGGSVEDAIAAEDVDATGCPFVADGTPSSLPPGQCCCDGAGQHVSAVCVAGAWKCAGFDAGYKFGTDMCNQCPYSGDVVSTDILDVSDISDIPISCANQPTCCCAGCTSKPSTCVNGTATCSGGYGLGTMSGGMCMCECDDVPQPDIPDTADTSCQFIPDGVIDNLPPFQCCCDGFGNNVSAECVDGAWHCAVFDAGYKFGTDICNPCSGFVDAQGSDVDKADSSETGPSALCLATGGSVTSGPCCASQSDFPNSCGIGGCSCAPGSTKTIQKCDCGGGKCFDPAVGCK